VDNKLEIVAVREISPGEELTVCYTDIFLPTPIRQDIFKTSKHFLCSCERCRLSEDDKCDDNCSKCGDLMQNDNQNIRLTSMSCNICEDDGFIDMIDRMSNFSCKSNNHVILQQKVAAVLHAEICRKCASRDFLRRYTQDIDCAKRKILKTSFSIGIKYK